MYKGIRLHLYPTKEQQQLLELHCDAARFIWNYMVDFGKWIYEIKHGDIQADISYPNRNNLINLLTFVKERNVWLQNTSNAMLQRVCADVAEAYSRVWKSGFGFPKFKSRYTAEKKFPARHNTYCQDGYVVLEKIGKVKFKNNGKPIVLDKTVKLANPRVKWNGRCWVFSAAVESFVSENQTQKSTYAMGIDLGVKEAAVVAAEGYIGTFRNIMKDKSIKRMKNRIKHLQRKLSKQKRGSNAYGKTKNKIKKAHRKIANKQLDYTHKSTSFLISLSPCRVVMETLDNKEMMSTEKKKEGKRVLGVTDGNRYEWTRLMKYKSEFAGIEFVLADKYFPSSQLCSNCGFRQKMPVSERTYVCPECGLIIDRDLNAAINLANYQPNDRQA